MEKQETSYTYIIHCTDDTLYTGITKDLSRRMDEHFNQTKKSAKYTKSHQADQLMMVWETASWSGAAVLEHFIKSRQKKQKLTFIKQPDCLSNYEEQLKGHHFSARVDLVEQINNSVFKN